MSRVQDASFISLALELGTPSSLLVLPTAGTRSNGRDGAVLTWKANYYYSSVALPIAMAYTYDYATGPVGGCGRGDVFTLVFCVFGISGARCVAGL